MAVFALIPAAGKSTRMGRAKLSLPVGKRTVLDLVITALKDGGIADILVVLGPAPHPTLSAGGRGQCEEPELAHIATAAGARVLQLAEDTPDMRATVERGLAWLETTYNPTRDDAWLLVPADHPTLDAAIVRELLAPLSLSPLGRAQGEGPAQRDHSILIPTYAGKRGHPTLIGWRHCQGIRELPAGQGLNTYLRAHAENVMEVPAASPEILCDLDTPEDYDRLLARQRERV